MSAVKNQNPLYSDVISDNQLIRDTISGDKSIKARGTTYVPKLDSQSPEDYETYLNRTVFSNYISRTKEGLLGLAFAKKPITDMPPALEELLVDATGSGESFYDLSKEAVSEVLSMGRMCYLEDAASNTEAVEGFSAASFTSSYKTESVINWRYRSVGGVNTLVMVVLEESEDKWIDEFTNDPVTIYRVLRLVDGKYEQNIYRFDKDEKGNETESIEVIIPLMNGSALTKIPFFGITPKKATLNPEKSPFYDIAKLNVSHFALDVDLAVGLHFAALPTPYGSGIQMQEGERIGVGSTFFHVFDHPDAKLDFLEFSGAGLQSIVDKLEEKKQTISVLGSRMLENSTKAKESFEAQSSRSNNERAILVSILDTASDVLEQILEVKAEWAGISGDISYSLNTDFNLVNMDSQTLKALTESWLSGAISQNVLFNNLQNGEIIDESMTYEEFKTQIEEETPQMSVSPIAPKPSNNTDSDASTLKNIANYIGLGSK
ncbi:MAG: DUF4055 domain-containing protein [Helicobacteraceae bacterium]|nr:DUF4055 domain-containing protein [Helicobacteraceae bacterium]